MEQSLSVPIRSNHDLLHGLSISFGRQLPERSRRLLAAGGPGKDAKERSAPRGGHCRTIRPGGNVGFFVTDRAMLGSSSCFGRRPSGSGRFSSGRHAT